MRFSTVFTTAAALGSALASPAAGIQARDCGKPCLTGDEAAEMAAVYQRLIAAYNVTDAETYLADEFVEYADSINVFSGQALGSPTFATKAIFEEAQAQNQPTPVVIKSIDAVDCDVIALRWNATFGAAFQTVNGITIIKNTKEKGYWQIKELDVEFNSLTYLVDIGGNYTI